MDESGQTIEEILNKEAAAFDEAAVKYGAFFVNAVEFNNLLNTFIKEVAPDAHIFVMFLAQVKKFYFLALLSVLRQHHVQGMLDLRQVLEAGANAAYGLANPNHEDYVTDEKDGTMLAPQSLARKRYDWLEKNYSHASQAIKRQKENINNSCAHSTLIYVFNNFEMGSKEKPSFSMSYFDKDDEYMVKTDLWFLGNTAMGLLDLFFGVNKAAQRIKFVADFQQQLLALEKENHSLKAEMSKHPRYVAAMERSVENKD